MWSVLHTCISTVFETSIFYLTLLLWWSRQPHMQSISVLLLFLNFPNNRILMQCMLYLALYTFHSYSLFSLLYFIETLNLSFLDIIISSFCWSLLVSFPIIIPSFCLSYSWTPSMTKGFNCLSRNRSGVFVCPFVLRHQLTHLKLPELWLAVFGLEPVLLVQLGRV